MAIEIVVAKAHLAQLADTEIQKEISSIETELNSGDFAFADNTVNTVFIKAIYRHIDRKMLTVCLFVNKTGYAIRELHGELRLHFKNSSAKIAKATINFDDAFMGEVKENQALLVHINIPVKGLAADQEFDFSELNGTFENVRVTPAESHT